MSIQRRSQAPIFKKIPNDPWLSMRWLTITVMPYVSKSEWSILMALWERTSRYGNHRATRLTPRHLTDGTEFYMGKTRDFRSASYTRFNRMPRGTFYRSLKSLELAGLVSRTKQEVTITAYPSTFFGDRLFMTAESTGSVSADSIIRRMVELTAYYSATKIL